MLILLRGTIDMAIHAIITDQDVNYLIQESGTNYRLAPFTIIYAFMTHKINKRRKVTTSKNPR